MNASTFVSLAILKLNVDKGKDYLDYCEPLVIEALSKIQYKAIDAEELHNEVINFLGLQIPRRTCEIILNRLKKRGLLTKQEGEFYVSSTLNTKSFIAKKSEAERRIKNVIIKLREFLKDKYLKDYSENQVIDILKIYLSKFGIDCLKTYLFNTPIPLQKKEISQEDIYNMHSFVKTISESNESLFEDFMIIVKGLFLSNALLCPDLQSIESKFQKVTFYLDTPVIMAALGNSGKYKKKCIEEMFYLIGKNKGKLSIFSHTIQELEEVLEGLANKIGTSQEHGKYIIEMKKDGITKSDLLLMKSSLKQKLNEWEISEKQTPKHIQDYQIDEKLLEEVIDDEIGYKNPKACQHDVDSISSIYTLRGSDHPKRLEDSKAVLVTTNFMLAKKAKEFGDKYENSKDVSTVLPDNSITNVAYLKAPNDAPSVPMYELLSYCYAGLSPTEKIWEKYINEIEKLKGNGSISANELQFLRCSNIAIDNLMELIHGDVGKFTPQTVSEIREELKKELSKDKEIEILKKEEQLNEKQNLIISLQEEKDSKEAYIGKQNQKLKNVVNFISKKIATILFCFVFVIVAVILFSAFWVFKSPWKEISIAASAILGLINIGYGINLMMVRDKFEEWLHKKIEKCIITDYK